MCALVGVRSYVHACEVSMVRYSLNSCFIFIILKILKLVIVFSITNT